MGEQINFTTCYFSNNFSGGTGVNILAVDSNGYVVKGDGLLSGSYELVTHAELVTLVDTEALEEGANYLITDFQTIYVQPDFNANGSQKAYTIDSVKTGTIEPLLVKATSNSTISHEAKSILFPDDTIEYLHEVELFTINPGLLTQFGVFTKGKIIRRKDRVGNDIPFDFRQVMFKRYETAPASGLFHIYNDNGNSFQEYYIYALYDSANPYAYEAKFRNNRIAHYGNPSANTSADNIWRINTVFLGDDNSDIHSNAIGITCRNNTILSISFGVTIGDGFTGNIINQIFESQFGNWCDGNTIGIIDSCTISNYFESNQGKNLFGSTFSAYCGFNDFGNSVSLRTGLNFYNNIIMQSRHDTFGNNCYNNTFSDFNIENGVVGTTPFNFNFPGFFDHQSLGNTFGDNTGDNLFGFGMTNNIINNDFGYLGGNVVSDNFKNNVIGTDTYSNTFYSSCKDNIINNGFSNNTVGEFFGENKIGNFFSNNDIGDAFYLNTIGSYFQNNTIGHNFGAQGKGIFNGNIVGNFCTGNIIADTGIFFSGSDSNTMGTDFSNNIINGEAIFRNDFGEGFRGNTILASVDGASNFAENTFKNETVFSVFNYGFQGNQIIGERLTFINMLPLFIGNIIKVRTATGISNSLDFSGSTTSSLVYNPNFTKEIVERADGTYRLKYMDNTDATIVVAITA